jgi:hypothetical protein
LLGLKYEAAFFVEINPTAFGSSVGSATLNPPLKDIVIELIGCLRRIGTRSADNVTKFA